MQFFLSRGKGSFLIVAVVAIGAEPGKSDISSEDLEIVLLRYLLPYLLDEGGFEFDNLAAAEANEMMMVGASLCLIMAVSLVEVALCHQP